MLSESYSSFHLKVLETIHILFSKPSLCKQRKNLVGLNVVSVKLPIQLFLHPKYLPYVNLFVLGHILLDFSSVVRGAKPVNKPLPLLFFFFFFAFYEFSSIMNKKFGSFHCFN